MVNESFYTWLALIIYTLVGIPVAVLARCKLGAGMNEFFLANRRIGGLVSALTYAETTYSAFIMIGLARLTYRLGVGALRFKLTYLCGLVLVVFFWPSFLAGRSSFRLSYSCPAFS